MRSIASHLTHRPTSIGRGVKSKRHRRLAPRQPTGAESRREPAADKPKKTTEIAMKKRNGLQALINGWTKGRSMRWIGSAQNISTTTAANTCTIGTNHQTYLCVAE
jgi:hypothetical protein